MISYLINKNVCFYFILKKHFSKKFSLKISKSIERIILLAGRDMLTN
jgi:hypothetical protein